MQIGEVAPPADRRALTDRLSKHRAVAGDLRRHEHDGAPWRRR